jgi:hypothetical protein
MLRLKHISIGNLSIHASLDTQCWGLGMMLSLEEGRFSALIERLYGLIFNFLCFSLSFWVKLPKKALDKEG